MAETGIERKVAGNDELFFIDPLNQSPPVYSLVVCLTGQSRSIVNDKIDAATKCGPDSTIGKQTIEVSIEGQQIYSAAASRLGISELEGLALDQTIFAWKMGKAIPGDGDVVWNGTGFLSNLEMTFNQDENSTFSASLGLFGTPARVEVDVPTAPTTPVTDDTANTFNWTNVAGYTDVADYETTIDSGVTWITAVAKPLAGLTGARAIGTVGVRVKADGVTPEGPALYNTVAYTV